MCLAVPGRIESIRDDDATPLARIARVSFSGTVREVQLAFVPEAGVGDYVLVHVGVALSRIDQAEAARTLRFLREMDEAGRAAGTGET